MGGEYLLITTLDWLINVFVPTFFIKLDSWYLVSGVSVLAVIGAMFIIWYLYRRFT